MAIGARKQPLYDQLVDILTEKIDHEYRAGDMIPSERELSERYGLSRTTVRLALQELERLGLVVRHPLIGILQIPDRFHPSGGNGCP